MTIAIYPIKVGNLVFKNYCYLVVSTTTKTSLLIDPAWELDTIEAAITHSNSKVTNILLTHHHHDHVNLAEELSKKYKIPVRMSQTEIAYYHFNCHNLLPIQQDDFLELGGIPIRCLLTPGHTKGAISYWIDHALFSGDTLFIEGCGACIYHGGDPVAMFHSLSYLKSTIPLETLVYPGHSYGQEPGKSFFYLLDNNIYLQIPEIQDFVAFRMRPTQKNPLDFS